MQPRAPMQHRTPDRPLGPVRLAGVVGLVATVACAVLVQAAGGPAVGSLDGAAARSTVGSGGAGTVAAEGPDRVRAAGWPASTPPDHEPGSPTGMLSPGGGVVARPAVDRLPASESCAQLRRWYVEAALPQVTAWGFDGLLPYPGPVMMQRDNVNLVKSPAPALDARAATEVGFSGRLPGTTTGPSADTTSPTDTADPVGNSGTGTNIQEAGVDEPDVAKSGGTRVVRVRGDHLVVTDVTGSRPRTLSRIELPGGPRVGQREMLLAGETAVVLAERQDQVIYPAYTRLDARLVAPLYPGATTTLLTRVDLTNPRDPQVVTTHRIGGGLVSTRQYGDGTVRLVVRAGPPDLDFVRPSRHRTPEQARRHNKRVVRDTTVEDWLPWIRPSGEQRRPLLDCTEVRRPRDGAGLGTLSLLTVPATPPAAAPQAEAPADEPATWGRTGIIAAGDLVYSSADRIYVATADRSRVPTTTVHAFALDATGTTYTASGRVRGTLRDRWSMDEHDGALRVATEVGNGGRRQANAVSVLQEQGGRLRVVGSVTGLGQREQIRSVRWFDDLAVLVTFRQTDPLYTVDLTEPTRPRVLGALKIRGFSGYLHPVGDDRVLGLGQDATAAGRMLGAQASLFDLADLTDVQRTDALPLGRGWQLPVEWEPRTVTYLPGPGLALVPMDSWRTGASQLVAIRVGSDGMLTERSTWPLPRSTASSVRSLPLPDGRVAVVSEREVRLLSP